MSWQRKLAEVLVCVGTLVKLVEVDPIYVVTDIFHGLLDGPGLHVNFLMYNAELFRVHWMSCVSTVEVYGGL